MRSWAMMVSRMTSVMFCLLKREPHPRTRIARPAAARRGQIMLTTRLLSMKDGAMVPAAAMALNKR